MRNVIRAHEYLAALENGEAGNALRRFFTPDFEQLEYPNRLNPKGQHSDIESVIKRSEQGKNVLRSQRYKVLTAITSGDAVALEVEWAGVLAIPVAGLSAGEEMRAHFALFLDFRDGQIARQRNYDCFEPWECGTLVPP